MPALGNRLTKIYTRTGDSGETGLADGSRVHKDCPRVEAMGAVDELNCAVGMVLAGHIPERVRRALLEAQHKLFDLGGELAMPAYEAVADDDVAWLEGELDHFNDDLPALKDFILPGGGPAAAACHMARAICRRAERRLVHLAREEQLRPVCQRYLNRLSDLLFVLGRVLARAEGGSEVIWRHDRGNG